MPQEWWSSGLLVLILREAISIDAVSAWGERLVGLALLAIGIWGIRTALIPIRMHDHTFTCTVVRHSRWVRCTVWRAALIYSASCRRWPCPRSGCWDRICCSSVSGSVAAMGAFASVVGWIAGRPRSGHAHERSKFSWVCPPSSPSSLAASGYRGVCDSCRPLHRQRPGRLRRHRDRCRTGGRAGRDPRSGTGRAHGTGDRRGVRRHGRQRRTGAGAGVGIRRTAHARRAATAPVRHHH